MDRALCLWSCLLLGYSHVNLSNLTSTYDLCSILQEFKKELKYIKCSMHDTLFDGIL